MQSGSRAVFLRFAGCNLWSGREQDRASAQCNFCDTDFVGTDGEGGGKFGTADALAAQVERLWGTGDEERLAVITGGEPMLQLDEELVEALHARGFRIAVESNGTLPATAGIDWLCISPKAGTEVVQRSGNELKLVWPQPAIDPAELEQMELREFPGAADGLRAAAGGDRRRDPAGDGAAQMAPVAAGAQGGGAALGLSRFRWSSRCPRVRRPASPDFPSPGSAPSCAGAYAAHRRTALRRSGSSRRCRASHW